MFNINLKQPDPGFNVILFQDSVSISTGYTAVSFDLVSSILGNMQSSSVYFSGNPALLNIYLTGDALAVYSAGYTASELLDLGVSFIGQGTTSGNTDISVDSPVLLNIYLTGDASLGSSNEEYTLESPITGLISIPEPSFYTSVDYAAPINNLGVTLSDVGISAGVDYTADINTLNLSIVETFSTDVDVYFDASILNLTTDIPSLSVASTSLLELTTTLLQPSISDGNIHINHILVDSVLLLTDIYEPIITATTRRLVGSTRQPTSKNTNKGKGTAFPVSKQLVDGNYSTRNAPLPVSKRLVDGSYLTKNTPLPI